MTQSLLIGIAAVVLMLAAWITYLVLSRRTRRSDVELAPADADAAREAERAGDAAVSTAMANRIREGRRGV